MKKYKKRKHFSHVNQKKRDRIESLLDGGAKQCEIAKILKVDKSTISRELRRKRKNGRYDADVAEHKASVKRGNSKYQGMKIEAHKELKKMITGGLKAKRSPDEIAGRMKVEKIRPRVGANAIYKWLYSAFGQRYCRYLCTQRWRRKPRTKNKTVRHIIPNMARIEALPKGAVNRTRYGHYETDTFVSPRKSGAKTSGAVSCEKKSKLVLGRKIPDMRPESMRRAMKSIGSKVNMKTTTMDRGIENTRHGDWGVAAYCCDPSSPWQKPLVEGTIGLLRRWFWPKGTNLSKVSGREFRKNIKIINNKYRKSLRYRSALEVAEKHGILKSLTGKVAFH
ncbi:MAG: IS30 family transposase [Patescibacteria group bacterium]